MTTWRSLNADHRLAYREANKWKTKEQQKIWWQSNPEKIAVANAKRRARLREIPGSYTYEELMEQYARQKGLCFYCRSELNGKFDADHVVPISRPELNPTNTIDNIVCACEKCNAQKKDKTPEEWVERWYFNTRYPSGSGVEGLDQFSIDDNK